MDRRLIPLNGVVALLRAEPSWASTLATQGFRLHLIEADVQSTPAVIRADIFTLARRMGTSVLMIDRTYGHLAHDAADHDRGLLEAFDATDRARRHVAGTESAADELDQRAAA